MTPWLAEWTRGAPCLCRQGAPGRSAKQQYRKQSIVGAQRDDYAALSIIGQYIVGSQVFGAQMMWDLENYQRDPDLSAVFNELLEHTERGGIWYDEHGLPVVLQVQKITKRAEMWFLDAYNHDQIDPVVRSLLLQPKCDSTSWKLDRYMVSSDVRPERPDASLREICSFIERTTLPGNIECAHIYLPVSGWKASSLNEVPRTLAMVRGLYDVVHVYVDPNTAEVRWILACNGERT